MEKEKIKRKRVRSVQLTCCNGSYSLRVGASGDLVCRANSLSELRANPDVQFYEKMFPDMFDSYISSVDNQIIDKLITELESLKYSLDWQTITQADFSLKIHSLINKFI